MLKIILTILLVIVVIFIVAMIAFSSFMKINTKALEPDEQIIEGKNGKKVLFLYQKSKHETGKKVAYKIAEEINRRGYTVYINHPSSKINYSLKDFEVLVFGSAVYMGTTSKSLDEYIIKNTFNDKKIFIYTVGSVINELKELELIKEKVKGNNVIEIAKFDNVNEDKIKEFINKLI